MSRRSIEYCASYFTFTKRILQTGGKIIAPGCIETLQSGVLYKYKRHTHALQQKLVDWACVMIFTVNEMNNFALTVSAYCQDWKS